MHFHISSVEIVNIDSNKGEDVISKKKTIPKSCKDPIDYIKEYGDWPNKWMIVDEDLKIGNKILTIFTPFIYFLIKNKFSVKTIKNHMLNLNLLGDEIIGRLNDNDEKNRALQVKVLILEYIEEGGVLLHFIDPDD